MTKKKTQYFKIINTKSGHYGVFYKVGINVDPNPIPLHKIPSCGRGAIYFTTAEELHYYSEYGDSIAWVTPISPVKKDEGDLKWKAHKINITKILPFKEAIRLIPEITIDMYESFGIEVREKDVLGSKSISSEEKLDWLLDKNKSTVKFIISNKHDKKFMKYVEREKEVFLFSLSDKEVGLLVDNDLMHLITYHVFRDLLFQDKDTILKKMMVKNPNMFLKSVKDYL